MKDFWNDRYGQPTYAYGKEPNTWFAECLQGLPSGSLLLPAEGEGRNAVHAARQGWQVSAFDISEAGRDKALALAVRHGVQLDYRVGTLSEIAPWTHDFDAMGLIFAHFPAAVRTGLSRQLVAHLRSGGRFIFEAFAKEQLRYQAEHGSGGPQQAEMLYSVEEVRAEFPGITFSVLEEVEVFLQEGPYHKGLARVVRALGIKN